MNLYSWLLFFHLLGLAVFLFAHGVSGGATLVMGRTASAETRQLLRLSQVSAMVSNPGLLVVIVTGIWMAFLGSFWGRVWVWAALVVLIAALAAMFAIARPYYQARDAVKESDDALTKALSRTRPLPAAWIGGVAIVVLIALMVLKPF